MTTLALAGERLEMRAQRRTGGLSLRAWLAGRWAIVFSHPEDFAQEQLEMDRWIGILSRSFSAWGIAAVALLQAGCDAERGWLGRLAGPGLDPAATLSLEPRNCAAPPTVADFALGGLRADIARNGPRFALIIDSDLRCHRTLRYRLPGELPSPLELVGWAVALRKRDRTLERRGAVQAHGYGAEPLMGSLAACDQPAAAGAARALLSGFPPQVQ